MMIIMIGLTWDERRKLCWHSQHTYEWGVVSNVSPAMSNLCIVQTEAHIEIYEDGRLIREVFECITNSFVLSFTRVFACPVHFAKSLLDCILPSECDCVARIKLPHKTYSTFAQLFRTRATHLGRCTMFVCILFCRKLLKCRKYKNKNWNKIKIENSRQNTLARRAEWKVLPNSTWQFDAH